FAQSVGGGGGVGGGAISTLIGLGSEQPGRLVQVSVSLGGQGGSGNTGGAVAVTETGKIATKGQGSSGIVAQSIGGGGGVGGQATSMTYTTGQVCTALPFGNCNFPKGATNLKTAVSLGGSGGTGANGGSVSVTSAAAITTAGDLADGIFEESVG